ncbi:MAG: NTP transferase domain-containing protein [Bacteroidetes bacterium]|nr:NTP transferase domain-containing protein [Bacteroidota bacterium]
MEVLILSGGNSSRMNSPKAFLNIKGISLIETLCNTYIFAGISSPIVVFNHNLFENKWADVMRSISSKAKIIKNDFPEKGRTYSIQLGLSKIAHNSNCIIQNIDNPEINVELLHQMSGKIEENGFVVPVKNGQGGHPILLGKNIVNHLKNLTSDTWILKEELKAFKRIEIDAGGTNVLLNLNTPDDWKNYVESIISLNTTKK